LAEDVAVLARALATHEQLACAQLLAWLFDGPAQALACATRDLGDLKPEEVVAAELLAPLSRAGPAVEVLRCAIELGTRHTHPDLPATYAAPLPQRPQRQHAAARE